MRKVHTKQRNLRQCFRVQVCPNSTMLIPVQISIIRVVHLNDFFQTHLYVKILLDPAALQECKSMVIYKVIDIEELEFIKRGMHCN